MLNSYVCLPEGTYRYIPQKWYVKIESKWEKDDWSVDFGGQIDLSKYMGTPHIPINSRGFVFFLFSPYLYTWFDLGIH